MKRVAPIVRAVLRKHWRKPDAWDNTETGIELIDTSCFQSKKPTRMAHRGMWSGKNPCDENSFGKVFARPYITVGKVGTRITPWLKRKLS